MALKTFDEARMRALKEYAKLERELCLLFRSILGVDAQIASAIFYQIASTRSRYAIISSLLEIRYPTTFIKPWKKLEHWLIPRDTARNHIVHWGQDIRLIALHDGKFGLAEAMKRNFVIVPTEDEQLTNNARRWRASGSGKGYSKEDLEAEFQATSVMKKIISRFNHAVYWSGEGGKPPWLDIFQQPIAHRTPEAFLERLNEIAPEDPPSPFL